MKTIKQTYEFKALQLKLDEQTTAPHFIYFKEHSVREHTQDKPSGRTLFVVNVPPYADERGMSNAFKHAGKIEHILFSLKPTPLETKIIHKFIPDTHNSSFRIAYIVFRKVSELEKALKLDQLNPLTSEDYHIKLGVEKWIDEYNESILQSKTLKEEIESFMKKNDEHQQRLEKKEKDLEQEDDEGWVTVTKKGKVQSFARSEKVESKIMAKEEKKKKQKELKNFYTFQIRESKMKHIVALRQKFEEDKKKIAEIKMSRRFKPF